MRAPLSQSLHHRRVARFVGAVAGLTGAVSMLIGLVAARWAPHGFSRFAVFVHLSRQPLIVRFASAVAAIAVATAAAAGIFSFYSWCVDAHEEGSSSGGPP